MIHNYWSHKYVADRLRWTECPRCHSGHSQGVLRGFRCLDCGLEAHRDAVGVLNMAARCGEYAVRPMVRPMLLR